MSQESPRLSIEVSAYAGREISKLPHAIARLILEEIRARLSTDPIREIKTRIKRLTGFSLPLYRLRVGDYRIYYSDRGPARRDPRHLPQERQRPVAEEAGLTVDEAEKAMPAPYATAYSNARGFSMRFEAFKISIPTMLPSLS
jgi:mRNA-degrading endonuclease RelE of RelBE toxin-antitoxin system